MLSGPIAALVGVLLGSWLGTRKEERLRQLEERRRQHEASQAACGAYLAAARQFDQYLKLPSTRIESVAHPTGPHPIPLVDEKGETYQHALEAASAGLLFVAVSTEVIERAGGLRAALLRLAAARDLGLPGLDGVLRTVRVGR